MHQEAVFTKGQIAYLLLICIIFAIKLLVNREQISVLNGKTIPDITKN